MDRLTFFARPAALLPSLFILYPLHRAICYITFFPNGIIPVL